MGSKLDCCILYALEADSWLALLCACVWEKSHMMSRVCGYSADLMCFIAGKHVRTAQLRRGAPSLSTVSGPRRLSTLFSNVRTARKG